MKVWPFRTRNSWREEPQLCINTIGEDFQQLLQALRRRERQRRAKGNQMRQGTVYLMSTFI